MCAREQYSLLQTVSETRADMKGSNKFTINKRNKKSFLHIILHGCIHLQCELDDITSIYKTTYRCQLEHPSLISTQRHLCPPGAARYTYALSPSTIHPSKSPASSTKISLSLSLSRKLMISRLKHIVQHPHVELSIICLNISIANSPSRPYQKVV